MFELVHRSSKHCHPHYVSYNYLSGAYQTSEGAGLSQTHMCNRLCGLSDWLFCTTPGHCFRLTSQCKMSPLVLSQLQIT